MERTIAYREQREAVLKLSDVYCIVLALFAIGIPTAFRPAFLFVYIASFGIKKYKGMRTDNFNLDGLFPIT